jgi:hypothetical protein
MHDVWVTGLAIVGAALIGYLIFESLTDRTLRFKARRSRGGLHIRVDARYSWAPSAKPKR